MEKSEYLERKDKKLTPRKMTEEIPNLGKLGIIGGIALLGVAALIVITLPDIKRYIKISTM